MKTYGEKALVINLSRQQLTKPPDLSKCVLLKQLYLSSCQLTEPPCLSSCQELAYLDLWNNQLTEPPDVTNCTKLVRIGLDKNPALSEGFQREFYGAEQIAEYRRLYSEYKENQS